MPKIRLDLLIVERGLLPSREQAQRVILAGEVLLDGHLATKPGTKVNDDAQLLIKARPKYVGRGGLKLEHALQHFHIDPTGLICLDVGASTGGFTDCLLQHGATRVHAIDVGTNQLAWRLRNDPRVMVQEQFNARHITPQDIGEPIDLLVSDVSFISLTKILPAAFSTLKLGARALVLIKPQFELQPQDIGAGGIVRDPALHQRAVQKIQDFVQKEMQQTWRGYTTSPITGADGNVEFLALLEHLRTSSLTLPK